MIEDALLIQNSEFESEDEFKINLSHVLSHAIGCAMTEVVPALEYVSRQANLSVPLQNMVMYAQLVARDLTAKTTALAELFGEPDSISTVKMASFVLTQFFDEFTKQLNQALSKKINCKISYVLDPDSEPDVIFDQRRISMILYYLISNSLQHGRTNNKNVKILCKSTKDSFELSVRDYGGGVPKEAQPTLFTKFRSDFSLKQSMRGMLPPRIQGIGLPLCRKLIQDMDGELNFRNYRSGAQFTMIIPQKSKGVQEPSEYVPDDLLMFHCMSSLWIFLEDKQDECI